MEEIVALAMGKEPVCSLKGGERRGESASCSSSWIDRFCNDGCFDEISLQSIRALSSKLGRFVFVEKSSLEEKERGSL